MWMGGWVEDWWMAGGQSQTYVPFPSFFLSLLSLSDRDRDQLQVGSSPAAIMGRICRVSYVVELVLIGGG